MELKSLHKAGLNQWILVLFSLQVLQVSFAYSQTLTATFPSMTGELVRFETFQGIQSLTLDSVKVDTTGAFTFTFKTDKPAIGYLITAANKPYFVILDKNERIRLKGQHIGYPESIQIMEGQQNQAFANYAAQHPRREQALSAWAYLEKIYTMDSLFATQEVPTKAIQAEKTRIKKEDQAYLDSLNTTWYVSWHLPLRRLVSDVSTIAQYRTEEIPKTITAFRKIDYTDERLYRSGLLKDALENHF